MFALIGLGNPGARYDRTRHNVGAEALRLLAPPNASWSERDGSSYLKTSCGGVDSILVLPQRYMNLSGQAAISVLRFFKVPVERIVVLHDELDLDPGVLRLKHGGGVAGHRGLEDLRKVLGSDLFFRVRIGIGHPRRSPDPNRRQIEVSDWVLSRPTGEEQSVIEDSIRRAAEASVTLVSEGLASAQQRFH